MKLDFEFMTIGDRKIIIRGLGKMFYQEGMPIGMMAKRCEELGYEVSWLHITDELLKHGWEHKSIRGKLFEELVDSGKKELISSIENFLGRTYDERRDMLFQYLFNSNREKAAEWFKQNVFRQ